MHLRRLTLVTFAAPLLFASCSSDDTTPNGEAPAFSGGSTPNQSADPLQPPAAVDNSPGTASPGTTTPVVATPAGNNEGQGNTETPLQPTNNPGTTPGTMDPGNMAPGNMDPGTTGDPVYATADGRVATAGRTGDYGNLVVIEHAFGLTTRYGHLSRIAVPAGAEVKRGAVIGYVGSTGRSTGSHLHYEVWANGRPVNPLKLLVGRPE